MALGKKEMTVVVIQSADLSSVPNEYKSELSSSKTGSIIPRGFVSGMGGDTVLMHYSYDSLKNKDTYKKFSELSRQEKKKPAFGSMAHMVMRDAKVKVLTREANAFKFGYPVKSLLGQLQNKINNKSPGADEAQAIIDVVNGWGEKEAKKITKLLESQPTKAYSSMLVLTKSFRGMPLVEEYAAQIAAFKKDKYFVYLYGLRSQFDKLKASERPSANTAKFLKGKLEQFITKAPDKELLIKDAESMIQNL